MVETEEDLRFNTVLSRPVEKLMERSLDKGLNIVEAMFDEVVDKSV